MRIGLIPGQAEALRSAFREQRQRLSRRAWAFGFLGVLGGGAAGYFSAPRVRVADTTAPPSGLHALCNGPIDDLRRQAVHVVNALSLGPEDPVLWQGYHRLVGHWLSHRDDEALRRLLVETGRLPQAPVHAREVLEQLDNPERR